MGFTLTKCTAAVARSALVLTLIACGAAASGCPADSGGDLFVRLRTDVRPGLEFSTARVQLVGASTASDPRQSVVYGPEDTSALLDGARLAEFSSVGGTSAGIRVTLLDLDGQPVLERSIQISDLDENTAVTAVITRDCRGVACPDPGGDPSLTECLAGRCVDPRCVPEDMTECPSPSCVVDGDCPAASACADGSCGDGVCLRVANDDRCEPTEWCALENGCIPSSAPPADAGMDSSAPDGSISDGGVSDGGAPDSGAPDSGDADAAPIDAAADADADADVGPDTGPSSRCGDGIPDLGELCDDGNTTAGDGCGPTCRIEGDSCRDALDMAVVGTMNPDGSLTFAGSLAHATDSIVTRSISTPERVLYWDAPSEGWMTWTTDTAALEFDSYLTARSACDDVLTRLAYNDDFGGTFGPFGTSSFLRVAVTAGQRVFIIVEPNESGCCAFDLIADMHPYLEAGATCDPGFVTRDCRPPTTCRAADGGFTCQ